MAVGNRGRGHEDEPEHERGNEHPPPRIPRLAVVRHGGHDCGTGSAITAEIIGLPILFIGALLLIIAWLPERRRKFPDVLEETMTPVPEYYLNLPEEGS